MRRPNPLKNWKIGQKTMASHLLIACLSIVIATVLCYLFGYQYTRTNAIEELERAKALGIRGLKVHPDFQKVPLDDPAGVPIYRRAAELGLPVLFHMGDDRYDYSTPERLMNLLRQVPDLQVIAAHFGGWRAWAHSYECPLPSCVLYDTSSTLPMIPRDMVLRMLDRFGPERFLFGTDFPMWSPKEELARFLALGLGEDVNEKILYGNFMKLFDLHDEDETEGA